MANVNITFRAHGGTGVAAEAKQVEHSLEKVEGAGNRASASMRAAGTTAGNDLSAGMRNATKSMTDFDRAGDGVSRRVRNINQSVQLLGTALKLFKWPAMIVGAGLATQALGALAAGAGALVASLGPLSGALAAIPIAMGAVASAVVVGKLAFKDFSQAMAGNEKALQRLTPEARSFMGTLKGFSPILKEIRQNAQQGLFPGLETALKTVMTKANLDAVTQGLKGIGTAMGAAATSMARIFAQPQVADALTKAFQMFETIIRTAGTALGNFGVAFLNLTTAAKPLIDFLNAGVLAFSGWAKAASEAGVASGSLTRFFESTVNSIKLVMGVLAPFGAALKNILALAKPLGDQILKDLGGAAQGLKAFTESGEGVKKISGYFDAIKPALYEAGRLVRDLVKAFFQLSAQPGLENLLRKIRTELLPALVQLISTTTQQLGPALVTMFTNIAKVMSMLAGATGPLVALVKIIGQIAGWIAKLGENSGVFKTMAVDALGFIGIWKAFSFASSLLGIKGLLTGFGLIGGAAKASAAATATSNAAIVASLRAVQTQALLTATAVGGVGRAAAAGAVASNLAAASAVGNASKSVVLLGGTATRAVTSIGRVGLAARTVGMAFGPWGLAAGIAVSLILPHLDTLINKLNDVTDALPGANSLNPFARRLLGHVKSVYQSRGIGDGPAAGAGPRRPGDPVGAPTGSRQDRSAGTTTSTTSSRALTETGSIKANEAVGYAVQQQGTEYVWGGGKGKGPTTGGPGGPPGTADGVGFDCSGLIYTAYKRQGIDLPRTSQGMASAGMEVSAGDLQPGDIIITNDGKHAVLYIGGGQVVAASSTANKVIVQDAAWALSAEGGFVTIRRVANTKATSAVIIDDVAAGAADLYGTGGADTTTTTTKAAPPPTKRQVALKASVGRVQERATSLADRVPEIGKQIAPRLAALYEKLGDVRLPEKVLDGIKADAAKLQDALENFVKFDKIRDKIPNLRATIGSIINDDVRKKLTAQADAVAKFGRAISKDFVTDAELTAFKKKVAALNAAVTAAFGKDLQEQVARLRTSLKGLFEGGFIDEEAMDKAMAALARVGTMFKRFMKDGFLSLSERKALAAQLNIAEDIEKSGQEAEASAHKFAGRLKAAFATMVKDGLTDIELGDLAGLAEKVGGKMGDAFDAAIAAVQKARQDFDSAFGEFRSAVEAAFREQVIGKFQLTIDFADAYEAIAQAKEDLRTALTGFNDVVSKGIDPAEATKKIGELKDAVTRGTRELSDAVADLAALPADASERQRREAQQKVEDLTASLDKSKAALATATSAVGGYTGALDAESQLVLAAVERVRDANREYFDAIVSQDRERIKAAIDEKIAANTALRDLDTTGMSERAQSILTNGTKVIDAEVTLGRQMVSEQKRIWEETKTAALAGVLTVVDSVGERLRDGKITWAEAVGEIGTALTDAGMDAGGAADLLGQNVSGSMGKAAKAIETAVGLMVAAMNRLVAIMEATLTKAQKAAADALVLKAQMDASIEKNPDATFGPSPGVDYSSTPGWGVGSGAQTGPVETVTETAGPVEMVGGAGSTPTVTPTERRRSGHIELAEGGIIERPYFGFAKLAERFREAVIPMPPNMDGKLRSFLERLATGGWRNTSSAGSDDVDYDFGHGGDEGRGGGGGSLDMQALMRMIMSGQYRPPQEPAVTRGGRTRNPTYVYKIELQMPNYLGSEEDVAKVIATPLIDVFEKIGLRQNGNVFRGQA